MPKRVSEVQIKEMLEDFSRGITIQELANKFDCTKNTVTRHLKKNINEKDFKILSKKNKSNNRSEENTLESTPNNKNIQELEAEIIKKEPEFNNDFTFVEIAPINTEISNDTRKDFASVPISDIEFPPMVYMIVDKNIELEVKYLKDYPNWNFLSQKELNRKTIEIYLDMKIAKRFCKKEQKVIKVPNTNVFRIAAPILLSKGISRIISNDKLIAL